MQTRLRTGSLSRTRQQSIDTDAAGGRNRMGSLDFAGISDDAGAQLVAGLKDSNTLDEVTAPVPLPTTTTTRMTTRRSAARAIPIPGVAAAAQQTEAAASGIGGISHTPPTVSHSFENQHFGKRPRAGVSDLCIEWICMYVFVFEM